MFILAVNDRVFPPCFAAQDVDVRGISMSDSTFYLAAGLSLISIDRLRGIRWGASTYLRSEQVPYPVYIKILTDHFSSQ